MDEETQEQDQKVITISKKKLVVTSLILAFVLVVSWGVLNLLTTTIGVTDQAVMVPTMNSNMGSGREAYMPPPADNYRYSGTPDVTDTREFLKTSYSARILTRDVHEVVETVEDAVHDIDGRIDSTNSNEQYGRVGFTVAKSDLSEFRDKIGEITHAKLYEESISSTNLLSQKQGIEERTTNIVKSLADLEQEKATLDAAHTQRVTQLEAQIATIQTQITKVESELSDLIGNGLSTSSQAVSLRAQSSSLERQMGTYYQSLNTENRTYNTKNSALVTQINQAGGNLEEVIDEDIDFSNNIETVSGYVDVRWVSLWQIGNQFSPTPMSLNVLILVLLGYWILQRIKIAPKFKLV